MYIPPFVNETEEEEQEPQEGEDDFESSTWWQEIREITRKKKVRKRLEKYIVDKVRAETNSEVELDDDECQIRWLLFWWWSCKKWVSYRLDQWEHYQNLKTYFGGRKRRSLLSNSTDSDSEIKAKRLCIVVKERDPPPKIGDEMVLVEEPEFEINVSSSYSFDVKLYTCLFWDEDNDEWSTKGCKVNCC